MTFRQDGWFCSSEMTFVFSTRTNTKAQPLLVRLSMSLQVYFRQLSVTDTVLDAKQNG
jgi:hypothetical protein